MMLNGGTQRILEQFETDVRSLKSENGYELTAKEFILGFNPVGCVNFPFVCYEIGGDDNEPITDGRKEIYNVTLVLALHYVFQPDTNKQGELIRMGQRALSDFRKFVHQHPSINIEKTLQLKKASNKAVNNINWYIRRNEPVGDVNQGNAIASSYIAVTFTENMNYTDNIQTDN